MKNENCSQRQRRNLAQQSLGASPVRGTDQVPAIIVISLNYHRLLSEGQFPCVCWPQDSTQEPRNESGGSPGIFRLNRNWSVLFLKVEC